MIAIEPIHPGIFARTGIYSDVNAMNVSDYMGELEMKNPIELALLRTKKVEKKLYGTKWITKCSTNLYFDWRIFGLIFVGFLGWFSSLGFLRFSYSVNKKLAFQLPNWAMWLEWLKKQR